ncbi:MAG TPA: PaaI family thioesterase [Planctomycetota bacterium]|nr:PaaI family thioesterase [Planctomycetota bacterium]
MNAADVEHILGASATESDLGLRLIECGAESLVLALPLQARFLQGFGIVHGGVLATLADSAAVLLLFPRAEDAARGLSSIEFKLNFLCPAVLDAGDVHAHAKVLRRGRRVGVAEVELRQAGCAIAVGLFTYLYIDQAP